MVAEVYTHCRFDAPGQPDLLHVPTSECQLPAHPHSQHGNTCTCIYVPCPVASLAGLWMLFVLLTASY